ncbi:translation initiation factor IF-2 [Paucilactobacillus hokkaidonensis JCM 18461]|uniref:Translation initiation factor IF-2 n=2 Tax=Paucilactobacillus hokkaidonensis TaxID=1193095 RepID=A0A0A1GXX2_9LACO|nr:translation initiation factor IF-2 [Paucilactobacillus hokkaidonensis]KRO10742.1 translation initiation factor IF-2 [Paucilactobacillus hokkaidonensis]BAP85734.1 translation initiation factor IF-2 [Paucilactobacillus hokkaidonensis JCM 18461]
MGKERIYELAKELNVASKDIVTIAKKQGIEVKNHMSSVDENQAKTLRNAIKGGSKKTADKSDSVKPAATKPASAPTTAKKTVQKSSAPVHQSRNTSNHNTTQSASNNHSAQTHTSAAHTKTAHTNAAHTTTNSNNRPHTNSARSTNSNNQHSSSNQQHSKQQHTSRPAQTQSNRQTTSAQHHDNRSSSQTGSNQQHNRPSNNTNQHRPASGGQTGSNHQPSQRSNNTTGQRPNNNHRGGGRFGGSLNNNQGRYNKNNNRFKKNKKKNKNQRIKETNNQPAPTRKERPLPETLVYSEGMNAQDLGKILHREPAEIVKKLFMLGVMVNQNQSLDKDTIEILAADYGINAEAKVEVDVADIDKFFDDEQSNQENATPRPPVVTVMGHVDHGKTTLLDKLRHTHVTAGEAGGITQAIGAYQVKYNEKLITFLDTPGHAAFTEMRARGANITDITVLVVAADDGVMPQTIEAINHAKAAETPIIVAVNKIDKPGANPNHVIEQLTEYGLVPENWGGDTIFVEISAKFGKNLDELLDMILLQAEVMELKANSDQHAAGSVIEARLDQGKGPVATLLVQQGTMHVGDPVVVGNTYGRVRTMTNELGRRIKDATPSTPVEITGLNDVPEAGDRFIVFEDEKTARAAGEERAKRALVAERSNTNHITLDNLFDSLKEGEMKSVPIIIKADVQGSVEALAQSLKKIKVDGVRVDIIHTAVGAINESDVTLAEASNAIIIGFNVRPTPQAKSQADSGDVDIRLHRVIYNAIDEVEAAMKGMLEPVYKEEVTGEVEVRELYKASKVGTIVGGVVTTGKINRDASVRLIRDGVVIYEGKLGSLKRFKDDVKEVKSGFELGLTIENFNDVKVNDVIEAYIMKEIPVE